LKYIQSTEAGSNIYQVHRETRRVEKRREETKQPRRRSKTTAREREIGERRGLLESSVAKERSRRSIIVGQQNVGQKKEGVSYGKYKK
jgi:hypothetical protein